MTRPAVVWEVTLHMPDGPEGEALAETWAQFAALPAWSAARLEGEAQLHLFLARLDWREADRARAREERRRQRRPSVTTGPEAPGRVEL